MGPGAVGLLLHTHFFSCCSYVLVLLGGGQVVDPFSAAAPFLPMCHRAPAFIP